MGDGDAVARADGPDDDAAAAAAEQRYIDRAYEHLDAMRDRAVALFEEYRGSAPALECALARRIHLLRDTGRALCFGRLDTPGDGTWYVGRRHVEDDAG